MSIPGDIVIGLDDFFSGFEEAFTERRRDELARTRDQVNTVAENLNQLVRFLRLAVESLGDLAALEAKRLDTFQIIFKPAPITGPNTGARVVDGLRDGAKLLKYTLTGLKITAKSQEWAITLTGAAAGKATEGIEAVVAGATQAARSSVSSGAAAATPAAHYAAKAEKFSAYAKGAGLLVRLLDRILAAIDIASMRNDTKRCKTLLETMKVEAAKLQQALRDYAADHQRIFGLYADDDGTAFVGLSDSGQRFNADAYHALLDALVKRMMAHGADEAERFRADLGQASRHGHVLTVALDRAIRESRDALVAFETKLDLSWKMLRLGSSPADLAESTELAEGLLSRITAEVPKDAAPATHRLRIEFLPDGDFAIKAAPRG
jgi:hypothetical protein